MTELFVGAIATGVSALACGVGLSRMLLRYRDTARLDAAGCDSPEVALTRYSVLARLTGEKDEQFLRTLPGSSAETVKRLRRERRAILRLYLRELAADFHRLHRAARQMVSAAPQEHAALVGLLAWQQLTFWRRLTAIEVRLALVPIGLPRVDCAPLLDIVESLRGAVAGLE